MDDTTVYSVDSSSDSEDNEFSQESTKMYESFTDNNNNGSIDIDDKRVLSTQEVFNKVMKEVKSVCDVSGVSRA